MNNKTSCIQAIRGMNDVLPSRAPAWQHVEDQLANVAFAYAFERMSTPIVEQIALFKRAVGETTDIVEKEMYAFTDLNEDRLCLRPEGTASIVRAGIQHSLFYHQTPKIWYLGPMFRRERPQSGRYRQFYQCGFESFGIAGPSADAELLILSKRLFDQLGLTSLLTLEINSLGTPASRQAHKAALVTYLEQHIDLLDADSRRRLNSNPLRILDSKNPAMLDIINNAPKPADYNDAESKKHFDNVINHLDQANIPYTMNPNLVRGLDYYTHTVFEWKTDKLGAQGTVCAGGRYDSLVEQLGGKPTPAVGMAMGLERLLSLIPDIHLPNNTPDIFIISTETTCYGYAMSVAETLRNALPCWKILNHWAGGSMKSQLKRADQSQARWAVIIGEDELAEEAITLKPLRANQTQQTLSLDQAIAQLKQT